MPRATLAAPHVRTDYDAGRGGGSHLSPDAVPRASAYLLTWGDSATDLRCPSRCPRTIGLGGRTALEVEGNMGTHRTSTHGRSRRRAAMTVFCSMLVFAVAFGQAAVPASADAPSLTMGQVNTGSGGSSQSKRHRRWCPWPAATSASTSSPQGTTPTTTRRASVARTPTGRSVRTASRNPSRARTSRVATRSSTSPRSPSTTAPVTATST